jgi:peptide/nickel transport system permease protein
MYLLVEVREKVSLWSYIVKQSMKALALYAGVIILTFFLLITPIFLFSASFMIFIPDPLIRTPAWHFVMTEHEIMRWALVPHPDVAEFLNIFARHVLNCFSGYFGVSFLSSRLISIELHERIANSALLICGSIFSSLLIGSGLVAYQEGDERGKDSQKGRIFSLITSSMPTFWLGMMALFVGSYLLPEFTGFGFPQFGTVSYDVWLNFQSSAMGGILTAIDVLFHLCLPMIVLTFTGSMFVYSTLKTTLTENLTPAKISDEYSKGKNPVFFFYSCVKSLLEAIKEWFPAFISTLILVEIVFNWQGLGHYLFHSILRMDLPAIRGSIITLSLIVILAKLILDISLHIMLRFEKDLNRVELCDLESDSNECYFIEKCR